MNTDIESTIKEITSVIIQFKTDIESNNQAGVTKFVNVFVPLLKRLGDFMLRPEISENEYYLNFRGEISAVYDQLFTEAHIFRIAERLINDNTATIGKIMAYTRNGNPLGSGSLKKSIGRNHFEDFVSKYQSLFDNKQNETGPKMKYPDKFYAWYHKILIGLGKADQFTPGAKQEIIDFGKRKYNTRGHGFYQAYMEFDLTKRQSFVTGLHLKDRKKWKEVIIDISDNDIDVITYLKEFPN